jgi:2-polyprenyl-6-methoxyphenol hydroxylase-like FAD-dependent oxidoreductase
MADAPTSRIAVVGGGVAGMGAALALAARGYASTVFEAARNPTDVDRGDVIHAGVHPVLESWGALRTLQARSPHHFAKFRIIDANAKVMLHVNAPMFDATSGAFMTLRHPEITAALIETAAATGLVEVRPGERVSELVTRNNRVIGVRTANCEHHAEMTIVATGASSPLRDRHFGKPRTYQYGTAFYNACIAAVDGYEDCGYYVLGRGTVMVLVPLPHDQLRIGIQFHLDRPDRPTRQSFAAIVRSQFPAFPADAQLDEVDTARTYVLRRAISRRLHIPGAVLLGDAAHVIHPTGGQGMNLAFRDADTLAGCIADADEGTAVSLDAAAGSYAKLRARRVRRVAVWTHGLGLVASSNSRLLSATTPFGLGTLNRATPIKQRMIRAIATVP